MYRVLIVEDDPMVAMINEQYILKDRHFQVAGKCSNGEAALKFLSEHEADLIVMDVYMPRMDGLETLRQIRSRQIPVEVILVTAANDTDSLEEALHLGVLDYLVKPFTFDRFQLALEKYLAQSRALHGAGTLNQTNIDHIIENSKKSREELFPKGIQTKTLELILSCLQDCPGEWLSVEDIAEKVGLTTVTVRRYMNFLEESGRVTGEMDYETGGRPSKMYKVE